MNAHKQQSQTDPYSPNSATALTHLHYKCFPSSTALSNDLLTVAVRSFHVSSNCKEPSSPLRQGNAVDRTVCVNNNRVSTLHGGVQLYVSSQVLGIGCVPLHSNAVDSPVSSALCHRDGPVQIDQVSPTVDMSPSHYSHLFSNHHLSCTWDREDVGMKQLHARHQQQHQSQQPQHQPQPSQKDVRYSQNSVLTLPVRYKDLSRDACIRFEIHTSRSKRVGTATLNLWDQQNRLKTGLQKIKVHLNDLQAHLHQEYHPSETNGDNMGNMNIQNPTICNSSSMNNIPTDEKWEACLILDKIQQMQNLSKSRKGPASNTNSRSNVNAPKTKQHQNQEQSKSRGEVPLEDVNISLNGLSNCHSAQSIPWLDSLTSKHCLDILNDNATNKKLHNTMSHTIGSCTKEGYLIVELEQSDFPILYHEQAYGHVPYGGASNEKRLDTTSNDSSSGNNSQNNSAIGSIMPTDLSLYHHEFMRQTQHDATSEELNNYMIQMPDLVHALNESQEMGIKLVQVLDFESRLSMDDNPVEDKYRTLQHELLRGLVDPALKPDAHERSQLNYIISGTSQHLSREEKGKITKTISHFVNIRKL